MTLENDIHAKNEEVHKDHQMRYEKGLNLLFNLGGGIGGVYAGAEVGLAIGTAISPGVGTVVGFAVGILVGRIGSVIGEFAKKKIQQKRAAETKRELEPYYDKIENAIKKTISEKFNSYSESVKTALDLVISERRKQEKGKKENLHIIESVDQVHNVENDIATLSKFKTSF